MTETKCDLQSPEYLLSGPLEKVCWPLTEGRHLSVPTVLMHIAATDALKEKEMLEILILIFIHSQPVIQNCFLSVKAQHSIMNRSVFCMYWRLLTLFYFWTSDTVHHTQFRADSEKFHWR